MSARLTKSTESQLPEPGTVINGKYLVEHILGQGGVGIVFAAQNLEIDERVALKFLRPEMMAESEVVARFAREAKAACSIRSEYVCKTYDVGLMPDGSPFLIMEYLDGENLDAVIQSRGRFGVREATEYVMQTCEALAVAHAKGIVHRDIKPENLFLTAQAGMQIVKVLDFGISKTALTGSVFGTALPLVRTVNLVGSPFYMSPEQIRSSESVDARSDIWSLGMSLYEMLTGKLPFSASSITELCAAVLEQPLQPITNHRHDLPRGYVEVIEKCLEKDVSRRYQNIAEVAIALMPFAPRRARICAERAVQALRAVGMVEESSVCFTSDLPPAAPTLDPVPDPSGAWVAEMASGTRFNPATASNRDSGSAPLPLPPAVPRQPQATTIPSFSTPPTEPAPSLMDDEAAMRPTHRGKLIAACAIVGALAAVAASLIIVRLPQTERVASAAPQSTAETPSNSIPTSAATAPATAAQADSVAALATSAAAVPPARLPLAPWTPLKRGAAPPPRFTSASAAPKADGPATAAPSVVAAPPLSPSPSPKSGNKSSDFDMGY